MKKRTKIILHLLPLAFWIVFFYIVSGGGAVGGMLLMSVFMYGVTMILYMIIRFIVFEIRDRREMDKEFKEEANRIKVLKKVYGIK